jgi:hypothetical protein
MRNACVGLVAVLLAATALLAGCSGDGDSGGEPGTETQSVNPTVHVKFPEPSKRSLRTTLRRVRQGPILAPSTSLLEPGRNRFGFALFDRGNRQIGGLKVALYVARGLDETAHGPFHARYEKIDVKPQFRSRNSSEDPDSARSLYVADVPFARAGNYLVTAVAQLGDRLVAGGTQVTVHDDGAVPGPGDRAIRVHTPTRDSAGGDLSKIETRVPPDTMHEVDLADALDGGRPVVLLFATPALCESRVCGPVTDVAEQVKSELGDEAEFIHMEIYNDNDASKGARPQFRAWGLDEEPVLFTIDRDGRIAQRITGAFSAEELRAAVRKATR